MGEGEGRESPDVAAAAGAVWWARRRGKGLVAMGWRRRMRPIGAAAARAAARAREGESSRKGGSH